MALNRASMSNQLPGRIVPDIGRLIPDESGNMAVASRSSNDYGSSAGSGVAVLNYEDSDLDSITRSQMVQDLNAYRYDLDFCQTQIMTQEDLSPQELRKLQIRVLDCAHNIRRCKHRIQVLDVQARLAGAPNPPGTFAASGSGVRAYRSGGTAALKGKHKRQRIAKSEGDEMDASRNDDGDARDAGDDDSIVAAGTEAGTPSNSLQRLGYWDCRLCKSRKYQDAGLNRVPGAPCKWPLKDISKMINHFLDLHTEHTPHERCHELGDALAQNRGPFRYWLTKTKSQDIANPSVVDDYIRMLQEGSLPDAMRGLLRSATLFPNTVSNSYRK